MKASVELSRRAGVVGLVALAGCQASTPEPREELPAIPRAVVERFTLDVSPMDPAEEPIHVMGRSERADREGVDAPSAAIELEDVLHAVDRHFPLILAAREEIEIAEGELIAARGGFDTSLGTDAYVRTEGFRETERLDVFLEQPTPFWGTSFEGGYRFGLGDFDFYEEGYQTNESGELRLGVNVPLFQGRTIDPRRVALWQARLSRDQADPLVLAKRLEVARKATDAYWKWVAAGRLREIALRLLALADDRTEQIENGVEEGLLAPINLTENQRLVVERQANLVRAERGLQETAIALSLYWRDVDGRPLVPVDDLLPYDFPNVHAADDVLIEADVEFALTHRPEIQGFALELESLGLSEELAENRLLPTVDLGVYASQDLGDGVSTPDDKGDFELAFMLEFALPLQLRSARGGTRELRARVRQLQRQVQFARERIVTEVQDARSALRQNWLAIAQARENVRLANELAELERFQLSVGESDLLRVNLREQQAAVAGASYVAVLRDYFRALGSYRAVIGVPSSVD
ncbi:MAG: TolC family protein [Planctomycetota bacterium]|jgi:outer membrane protein TolC